MPYIDSLRVFVRVVELGSITSGGRDLRMTPAVASKRIKELEAHLGVRLFNRTTRTLSPTEVGRVFYDEARKVLDSVESAEAAVASHSSTPRGVVRLAAPLGVGRRIIAPLVPDFVARFPDIQVQMRLSDRVVDLMAERLDVAFFVGQPQDSTLKLRRIESCRRVLCAAPGYLGSTAHRDGPPTCSMAGTTACCCAIPARPSISGRWRPAMARASSRSPGGSTPTIRTCSPTGCWPVTASPTGRFSTWRTTSPPVA